MTFEVDQIEINLTQEPDGIRLIVGTENLLLYNQTAQETKETVQKNFEIVKRFYQPKAGSKIDSADLKAVSLKIVLYYFYLYNMWRNMYKRERDRDLTFLKKTFPILILLTK
jgi:hypothetical protein